MRSTWSIHRALAASLFPLVVAAAVSSCGPAEHPPADQQAAGGPLDITFTHAVGTVPVSMGSDMPYVTAAGNTFGVTLLQYFVSRVTVTMADGTTHAFPGAHYVDQDVSTTHTLRVAEHAPAGSINSVSLVIGLPPDLNTSGAFTSSPESLMEWPEMMGGGYHHVKFEGRYVNTAGEPFNFKAHSGGLMGADHSVPVTLPAAGHAVTSSGATLTLRMQLDSWFATPHTWDLNAYFNASAHGIMGNEAAQQALEENGADVFLLVAP